MHSTVPQHAVKDNAHREFANGMMLGRAGQRVLLSIHIVLACVWIGALMAILILVSLPETTSMAGWRSGLDRAVLIIHETLIVNASYAFILTGLAFSLFTQWGAFRFWWVALKWLLLAVLGISLPLWVAPHISAMTALSDAMPGKAAGNPVYLSHVNAVLIASILQLAILTGVVVLSVFKPWGRRETRFHIPRLLSLMSGLVIVAGLVYQLWLQEVLLEGYRRLPVTRVDARLLRDGIYEGSENQSGFNYRVRVTITDGLIAKIDVISNRDSEYARLAILATEKVTGHSSNDVDAISGATTSSKALMRAVSDALQLAPAREASQ